MRMRLGLLHDPEAQKRMFEREQRAAEEKQKKAEAPTVRTEAEQKKHDEQKTKDEKEGKKEKEKKPSRAKIRPLSDARAIELGANFFSETFIFMVAVGLLLVENYRSRKQASNRRDEVQERLEGLETQIERLKREHNLPELEALNERIKKSRQIQTSWWNPAGWFRGTQRDEDDEKDRQKAPTAESDRDGSSTGGKVSASSAESVVKSAHVASNRESPGTQHAPPARLDLTEASTKQR